MTVVNNNIIAAPVSMQDVRQLLGNSSTDLATLCMASQINMWAARKPIYNTKVTQLTDADWKGNGRTLSGFKTGGGIKKWANTYAQYISGMNTSTGYVVSQVWAHDKPVRDGLCAFRLTDFSGYYHNVGRAFSITTLFGNLTNLLIPSRDGLEGRNVAFTMGFASTTPDGGIAASQLFGDCWNYYPAVIFTYGLSGDSYNIHYAKAAPNPISAYAGSSVTINVDTAEFASAIADDYRAHYSGDPYANYPLRTGSNWTACLVLLSYNLSSYATWKVPPTATIVRLEYSSGCDRKTLPIKQSKYLTIDWMKMNITIQRVSVSGNTSVYRISSITVTAKMLTTEDILFEVGAQLSTPQGTVNVVGTASGQSINVDNYTNVKFSGTAGEVTKTLGITETTYTCTATTIGNKLCNGTLTFKNTKGDFSGTFSFDVSGGSGSYAKEVDLL